MKQWLEMFLSIPFKNIPEDIKDKIIQNTVEILKPQQYNEGNWYLDYERLRIKAIKE